MTIFRVVHDKNNPYLTINTTIADDDRLSYKAKGIWFYAFSRKDDWQFNKTDLNNRSTDGDDSVSSGLKELENYGYLYRKCLNCPKTGKLQGWDWYFFETSKSPEEIQKMLPKGGFSVGRETRSTLNPVQVTNHGLTNTDVCTVRAGEPAENANEEKIIFPKKQGGVVTSTAKNVKNSIMGEFAEHEIDSALDIVRKMEKRPKLSTSIEKYISGIILQARKNVEIQNAIARKQGKKKSPFDLSDTPRVVTNDKPATPEEIKKMMKEILNEEI